LDYHTVDVLKNRLSIRGKIKYHIFLLKLKRKAARRSGKSFLSGVSQHAIQTHLAATQLRQKENEKKKQRISK
jgi:hypothetical protein